MNVRKIDRSKGRRKTSFFFFHRLHTRDGQGLRRLPLPMYFCACYKARRIFGSLPVVCVVVMSEYRPAMYCGIEYAVSAHVRRNVLRVVRYYVLVLRHALPVQAVLEINDRAIKQLCKDISGRYMPNNYLGTVM